MNQSPKRIEKIIEGGDCYLLKNRPYSKNYFLLKKNFTSQRNTEQRDQACGLQNAEDR